MFEQIQSDMIKAMKEQDKFRLTVIRMLKASIDKVRIDKKIEITDEVVIDVLAKELKTREESKIEFAKANREDLVSNLDKEIAIIKEYLPEPLSEEEIDKIIEEAIKEENATTIKDMGKVMGSLRGTYAGQMDFGKASEIIKSLLA